MRSIRRRLLLSTAIASLAILASLFVSVSFANAQNSDFSINANPVTLCVNPGIDATSVITLSSLGGYTGTVNLSDSVSAPYGNGPTLSSIQPSETLASGQSISFNLTMYTTTSTPLYTYTVTISGIDQGGNFHEANIYLTVTAGCSVGGVIVPMAHGTTGSDLMIGIVIAGLVGVVGATLVVYVSRIKSRTKP
jgi:hypothetical protein